MEEPVSPAHSLILVHFHEISSTDPIYCAVLRTENKLEKVQRSVSELDTEPEMEYCTAL